MPEIVKCPECKRTLRVPDDLLGKTVRCPSCQVTFTAQAGDAEPPPPPMPKMEIDEEEEQAVTRKPKRRDSEDDDDDRPARRRRYDDDNLPEHEDDVGEDDEMEDVAERRGRRVPRGTGAEWRRVRSGIGYLLAAVYTLLGLIVVYCCGIFVVGFAAAGAAGAAAGGKGGGGNAGVAALGGIVIVAGIVLLGLLAALVLQLIGLIFCTSAPEYRGGRMLAKITLGLFITYLAAQVTNWILAFVNPAMGLAGGANPMAAMAGAGGLSLAVSGIGALASFGYYGTMIFMLRSLALALREEGLARNAMYFFIYYVVFVVFAIIASVVFFAVILKEMGNVAPGQGPPPNFAQGLGFGIMAFSCIIILLSLGMLIWYIITLVMTRIAIGRAVRI
jgi:predicted Zn finger-like uncharacterized protein